MKKLFILLTVLGMTAFSFQGYSQTNFGIKAGLNINNINQDFEESVWEWDTKMKAGFHIGPTVDIALSDQLGLQTGLFYTSKGFSDDLDEKYDSDLVAEVYGYKRTRFNYFEIPVNFAFKIDEFQIFAGPYLAIGVGGKSAVNINVVYENGSTISIDGVADYIPVFGDIDPADLDNDEIAFNALDFGLNFGLGYKVGPMLLNVGYSLGLGNITTGMKDSELDPADYKMSNRVIKVSVSFFF